ncbi:MAG TPA: surface-adhesin E family protein [Candidatus Sulfotelmatobacter sp.]|nr:surface-adhesin E family protein [Candidatus Sulfotelmatobacter sp.]
MKKFLALLGAIILATALATVVAHAAGDWRQIGSTAEGAKVSVSSVRVKRGLRTTWVRVEYKEPTKLPQGGPFVEMRARVRFVCASGSSQPTAVWFYSRDRSGKTVVSKKASRDDRFGSAAEGGFEEMVRKYVCEQK